MSSIVISLVTVIAIGFALWGIMASASLLLSRYEGKPASSNLKEERSRLLRDLRPLEDLLVGFITHTEGFANTLRVLVTDHDPLSLKRIVREARIARDGSTNAGVAVKITGTPLCILYLAGVVRFKRGRFVATPAGREVHRRMQQQRIARNSADNHISINQSN